MQLPSERNPVWYELISSKGKYQIKFLAFNFILTRLNLRYQLSPTPSEMEKCIHELWTFLNKNSHQPKLHEDLNTIFGKGAIS